MAEPSVVGEHETGGAAAALGVIMNRRSVGVVEPGPVPQELIEVLLAAAVRAPNHKLTQPWRFIVLEGDARRALGTAHAAAVGRLGGEPPSDRDAAKLERAPVVIVCASESDRDDPVQALEDRDAVAAAVQNLLLAAEAIGLAAIWRTGTMPFEPEVKEHLGLAGSAEIVAFVYLGWPRAGLRLEPRAPRPLEGVVEWRST